MYKSARSVPYGYVGRAGTSTVLPRTLWRVQAVLAPITMTRLVTTIQMMMIKAEVDLVAAQVRRAPLRLLGGALGEF